VRNPGLAAVGKIGYSPDLDRGKPDGEDDGVVQRLPGMNDVGSEDDVVAFLLKGNDVRRSGGFGDAYRYLSPEGLRVKTTGVTRAGYDITETKSIARDGDAPVF
jgi:hypothetical protein